MSLRAKLLVSYAAVILLAVGLAGVSSLALRRGERRQAALDRLAAAQPQITVDIGRYERLNASPEQITDYVKAAAREQNVRVLLIDKNNIVTTDSDDSLKGKRLERPAEGGEPHPFAYRVWRGTGDQKGLVFVGWRTNSFSRGPVRIPPGGEPSQSVVLAVPQQTLARAWIGLLPGLAWAGLIALGLSTIVAVLLARSIARPLQALTRASEAMARGDYDQEIPLKRRDEVGRLAAAFNEMARQVGRSHVQMRSLIANVSHDLKTPLTSILGFSQALRDRAVDGPDQTVEMGGIIHEEAERVQDLVSDLLYLSEIEAGQVVMARDLVDLGALATRAVRRFEPGLQERRIELVLDLPASTPALPVQGDSAKLERVLDNLLDNARKYAPDGGRVRVEGTVVGGYARLSVFNSGSYIAPEDLPRVFDRFYRQDRARTRATGSGLGLAIARELVDLHRGSIAVTSDSSGTTFTVSLPRAIMPVPRADIPGLPAPKAEPA